MLLQWNLKKCDTLKVGKTKLFNVQRRIFLSLTLIKVNQIEKFQSGKPSFSLSDTKMFVFCRCGTTLVKLLIFTRKQVRKYSTYIYFLLEFNTPNINQRGFDEIPTAPIYILREWLLDWTNSDKFLIFPQMIDWLHLSFREQLSI